MGLKGLNEARRLIDQLQNAIGFSDYVKQETTRLYWTLACTHRIGGFKKNRLVAALTFHMCEREGIGTSMQEISKVLGITKWELYKTLKTIKKRMKLETTVPNIESLVLKYGNSLGLKQETITKAIEIAKTMEGNGLNPLVSTGLSLHLAVRQNNETITMKAISKQLNISESAIQAAKCRNNLT